MNILILTRGIPGAGKTQWARSWVAEDPASRARVNRDDIRMQLFNVRSGCDENAVTVVQDATLRALMRAGWDVVLDNTNLNPISVRSVRRIAEQMGYELQFRDFEIDLDTAVMRDMNREHPVGADVVRRFFERYTDGGRLVNV